MIMTGKNLFLKFNFELIPRNVYSNNKCKGGAILSIKDQAYLLVSSLGMIPNQAYWILEVDYQA